jgi:3-hydroxyisobutyrate dehydrogenase-like beta-hydroxyacid dehydrogenase
MQTRIGFAGLGLMGQGMAKNFLKKGYPLTVWNRNRSRAEALAAEGAHVASTPRELAAASDVVFTCLADPVSVEQVATGPDGLLAGARAGLRWVETSTIGMAASLALGREAADRGVEYLEAPVTGSKLGAASGQLVVMTGGPRELHDALAPIIGAFAAKVIHCGPLGTAAMTKLVGNTIISFMLEGLAEGAVVAERAGVRLETILEVVQASGFASPYWTFKGGAMQRRDFETHFSIDLMHKDQALMLAEASARKVPMPGLAAIHGVMTTARACGFGGEDIAAQIKAVEVLAGQGAGVGPRLKP